MKKNILIASLIVFSLSIAKTTNAESFRKSASVLCPKQLSLNAIANAEKFDWARQARDRIVEQAQPWLETSDEDLWAMMFGPAIPRSWMVWSDGYCPACKKDVKMYSWIMDPWDHPFKTQCPHCKTLFPANDFAAFHRSGLNEQGIFDPARADRSLLFNQDHPDKDDPLRQFGVDDGTGYTEGDKKWRFIGAYLIYGQWKKLILAGINNLSEAYFVTGDLRYAHKAAILLDRIADVYPTFDFIKQAVVYERDLGCNGYISTWHDACEEVRELAQAYDLIFDALPQDDELVRFLADKAKTHKLENKKQTFADIQDNIENNIFRDTIAHEYKIRSNYPRTPAAILTMETVIGWPANRDRVMQLLSEIVETSTTVDGVTGEKGLTGYATIGPHALGELIGRFDRLDPNLLEDLYKKFPILHRTFRFHIDTWCMETYYPRVGDCGTFGQQVTHYAGLSFRRAPAGSEPSMFRFLWRLYQLTNDPAFIHSLYLSNGKKTDGLPYDLCAADPEGFQNEIARIIKEAGTEIDLPSVNKEQWRLAILRAGSGTNRRAAWIDYDSTGRHSHRDGMNIGLFSNGLDLLPDFGYPPVGYGGWDAPKAVWYTRTAAHNTVAVDGKDQERSDGKTTLWGIGKNLRIIRVSDPNMIQGEQYERTLAQIDLSPTNSYLLDLFHVKGGSDHAKFITPLFGTPQTIGLNLQPASDYGFNTLMRNTRSDPAPSENWSVDWAIDDFYKYRSNDTPVHLRYTDLTPNAEASLSECWVDVGENFGGGEKWVSRLTVRRKIETAPLQSCFVSLYEPYEEKNCILNAKRLPLSEYRGRLDDTNGAAVIELTDGRRHIFAYQNPKTIQAGIHLEQPLSFWGLCCYISIKNNEVECLALAQGKYLHYGKVNLQLKEPVEFIEIAFENETAHVLTGDSSAIESLTVDGKTTPIR